MPTTYPLTMPGKPGFTAFSLRLVSAAALSQSEFTGVSRSFDWGGRWWRADWALPEMPRHLAEEWIAFMLALNGAEGNFWLGDPDGRVPRGTTLTAPRVNGAGQTGESLIVDNLTASQPNALMKGDYVQVNNRLHKLTANAASDGSGNATLTLRPELDTAPADNLDLVIAGARGLFRMLPSAEGHGWDTRELPIYRMSFAAIEDVGA